MAPKEIVLPDAVFSGTVVTDAHFGANVLMTMNFLDPGGPFDRLLQQMGTDDLRFPGGSLSEELLFLNGDQLKVQNEAGSSST